MFEIPFYIFICLYFGITFISVIIFFISYHHIHSTGTLKGGALLTTLILGGLLIIAITGTIFSLNGTNWSEPIVLGNSQWFEGIALFPQ